MGSCVDGSLTILRSAAINAQHAALRYHFQTTGLRATITPKTKDHGESSPSPSEIRHIFSYIPGARPERKDSPLASNNLKVESSVDSMTITHQPADPDRLTTLALDESSNGMGGYQSSRQKKEEGVQFPSTLDMESGYSTDLLPSRPHSLGMESGYSIDLLPSRPHQEDIEFAQLFRDTVYPFLQASVDFYAKDISKDKLFSISMELSKAVFASDFRSVVKESSYSLDEVQKGKLKKYVHDYITQSTGRTAVIDLTSADQEEDVTPQSNGTSSNGALSDSTRLLISRRDTQPNPLDGDISLLGPGQMPEAAHRSHKNRFSDDLSLLGPGEVHRPLDPSSNPPVHGRLSLADKQREKSRYILRLHQPSGTPVSLSGSHPQLRAAGHEAGSSSDDSDNVLGTWLSPLKISETKSGSLTVEVSRAATKKSEPNSGSLKSVRKTEEHYESSPSKLLSSSSNRSESKSLSLSSSVRKQMYPKSKSSGSKPEPSRTSGKKQLVPSFKNDDLKASPLTASTKKLMHKRKSHHDPLAPATQPSKTRSHGLRPRGNVESPGMQPHALRARIVHGGFSPASDPSLRQSIASLGAGFHRPYKPPSQENMIDPSDMHGTLKHVEFSDEECEALHKASLVVLNSRDPNLADAKVSLRLQLKAMLKGASYAQVTELIQHVHADTKNILCNREAAGIRDFLADLKNGRIPDHPGFIRVKVALIDPMINPRHSTASLLRSRELGCDITAGRHVQSAMRVRASENIFPWRKWKGASGDVVTCAWAPNSQNFAFGAAAPSNNEDLQYNRPRNLLLGDLRSNTLNELPDHRVDRPRPEMIPNGPNADQAMYNSLDPMVYTTISSLQFSRHGSQLFTASHDKTAKIWSVSSSGTANCFQTLYHDAIVTDLDVSQHHDSLFATASMTIDDSIRVYHSESLESDYTSFSSPRAQMKSRLELYPECLRWGKTPNTSHILLAGFQQWFGEGARDGDICLWDVSKEESLHIAPSKLSVFTATWHPLFDIFAVGGAPPAGSKMTHLTTRSVVRTWDIRIPKRVAMEFECPALDMQDLTFNPLQPEIVTAGCTDSATYVWDFRMPIDFMVKLQHDRPIMDWDHTRTQEEADAGVMMTLWGLGGSKFYTGSSDGIIKCWDPFRAPEDALIGNMYDMGASVQSGAFSPDFAHLLVGDSDGGVHVLTSAPVDQWETSVDFTGDFNGSAQGMKLVEASDQNRPQQEAEHPGDEGIMAARKLLKTQELVLDRAYGVGKGPNYAGPYATYARMNGVDPNTSRFLPEFDAFQAFSRHGNKRVEIVRRIKGIIKGRRQFIAQSMQSVNSSTTIEPFPHEGRLEKLTVPAPNWRKRAPSTGDISPTPSKKAKTDVIDLTKFPPKQSHNEPIEISSDSDDLGESDLVENNLVEDNIISDSEYLEENYWWPLMDQEILARLRKC